MFAANQNSAMLKNKRCRLVERHFMNSQTYLSKDNVLFKIGHKKEQCRAVFQRTAVLKTLPATKAQFGIDLHLGGYSLGSTLFCQTYLANLHVEPESPNFSFVSVKFLLGLTDSQMLLLSPQSMLTDQKTYDQEYHDGQLQMAFQSLVNRNHIITRPLSSEEIEKIRGVEEQLEYCFKFKEFTNMANESFKKITQFVVPCIEKAFILKIANHLLYTGYISRITTDEMPYEPLTMQSLEKTVFKINVIRDNGRKIGELICDMNMAVIGKEGNKDLRAMDLNRCFAREEDSITSQCYFKAEIAVDHTSPLYYRSRIVNCYKCGAEMNVCQAKPSLMRIYGDGYYDLNDMESVTCAACMKGEYKLAQLLSIYLW